jgi:hypothetical protein
MLHTERNQEELDRRLSPAANNLPLRTRPGHHSVSDLGRARAAPVAAVRDPAGSGAARALTDSRIQVVGGTL